jgi:hypothetical protein
MAGRGQQFRPPAGRWCLHITDELGCTWQVVMEETIVGGALRPFADILNPLLHPRNAKALERLERLAAEEAADA